MIERKRQIFAESSYIPEGKRHKCAKSNDISMLKWIILDSFHWFVSMKSSRVTTKNPIKISEAPLVNIVAVV